MSLRTECSLVSQKCSDNYKSHQCQASAHVQSPSDRFPSRVEGWLGAHSSWSMLRRGQVMWASASNPSQLVDDAAFGLLSRQQVYIGQALNWSQSFSVCDDRCHSKGSSALPSKNPRFSSCSKASIHGMNISQDNMRVSRKNTETHSVTAEVHTNENYWVNFHLAIHSKVKKLTKDN